MTAEPVEFDCPDCGIHVFAFNLARPPEPPRCATCAFIAEFVPDPAEAALLRDRFAPSTTPRRFVIRDELGEAVDSYVCDSREQAIARFSYPALIWDAFAADGWTCTEEQGEAHATRT